MRLFTAILLFLGILAMTSFALVEQQKIESNEDLVNALKLRLEQGGLQREEELVEALEGKKSQSCTVDSDCTKLEVCVDNTCKIA